MKLIRVLTAKWADPDHAALTGTAEVEGVEGEWHFAVHDGYATKLGQSIWDATLSGDFAPIGEYVPPSPEPEATPDEISRRQFFQYLAVLEIITRQEALAALQSGAIPAPLQAIIDELPSEDDRFEAQMFIIGAQNFNRLHWLTDRVRLAMQWTLEQRDYFWREASKL